MNNEKLDTTLNLSLETGEAARQKSEVLSSGVDEQAGTWEIIVKYHGDISEAVREVEAADILLNGYAIMVVTRAQLERLVQLEQIEFIEMPKQLQYNTYRAKQASCILPVTTGGLQLSGRGVLVACIDSGIDYMLRDFQNENGSRILYLWDQTLQAGMPGNDGVNQVPGALSGNSGVNQAPGALAGNGRGYQAPNGFSEGIEFTKEDIDRAIESAAEMGNTVSNYERAREIVPSLDITGHGTAVAGIAAGSAVSPLYRGVAPRSDLIIVKLRGNRQNIAEEENTTVGNRQNIAPEENPTAESQTENQTQTARRQMRVGSNLTQISNSNFPLTTDLMRGITYVIQKAEELGRPVVINLSIGDTYGAHDGTSLLERFIDSVCDNGRNVICIGSGNEAVSNGHTSFILEAEVRMELTVAERERGTNVQLWKNYVDECMLEVEAPNGNRYTVALDVRGKQTWVVGNTQMLIYVSPPKPFTVNEEIIFDFIPTREYIDSGIWTFILTPVSSNQHDYHMYLPNSDTRNSNTRFLTPTPELTMTIPAFATRALTVGAYDIVTNSYADFSGRDRNIGEEERIFFAANVKPDIVAPGVNITAPAVGGGYASFTGTSFATPIVTGSVALLLEWGIVRGNDRFLYGEKIKAYLRKGAKALNGDMVYPNPRTGWGALCVSDSLPG